MIELLLGTIGLVIGSFLNVCIYRLPLGMSVVRPPSHCPACKSRLTAWDLVPVVSYIFLQGQCRHCQAKISGRYAMVELLTAVIFLICLRTLGLTDFLPAALIFACFMIVITFIDYDHQLILDSVLIPLAVTGLIVNSWLHSLGLADMLIGSLAGGGLLLVLAIASRGGMGGGDIKFAAALGIWLGWKLTLVALLLAFIMGGFGSMLLMILKLKKRKDMIPFGPFIAIGAFISLLYGNQILVWYLRSFL